MYNPMLGNLSNDSDKNWANKLRRICSFCLSFSSLCTWSKVVSNQVMKYLESSSLSSPLMSSLSCSILKIKNLRRIFHKFSEILGSFLYFSWRIFTHFSICEFTENPKLHKDMNKLKGTSEVWSLSSEWSFESICKQYKGVSELVSIVINASSFLSSQEIWTGISFIVSLKISTKSEWSWIFVYREK